MKRGTGAVRGRGNGLGRRGGFRARYGESPFHLLLVLCSFGLAGYAGVRLLDGDVLGVLLWFVGAAVVHDLVLVPLYSAADRALRAVAPGGGGGGGRGPGHGPGPGGAAERVNYVRVPLFVSLVLLLVWYPLILGRNGHYAAYTTLDPDVFLGRWLLITAGLFAVSALCLAARTLRTARERRRVR